MMNVTSNNVTDQDVMKQNSHYTYEVSYRKIDTVIYCDTFRV